MCASLAVQSRPHPIKLPHLRRAEEAPLSVQSGMTGTLGERFTLLVTSCSRVLGRISEFSRRALLIVRMVIQRCLPRLLAGPYTGPTHTVRLSARRREQPALFEPERQEECKVATAVLVEVDADEAARRSANGSTEFSRSAWSRMMSSSVPQRLERLGRRNLLPCTVTARDSSTHTE